MDVNDLLMLLFLVGASFAIALSALAFFARLGRSHDRKHSLFAEAPDSEVAFLFDDEKLLDATPQAKRILSMGTRSSTDWAQFVSVFLPRFPDLKSNISSLAKLGEMSFDSADGSAVLNAKWRKGLARLSLVDQKSTDIPASIDQHSLAAMEHELTSLRGAVEHTPYPVWRETSDGTITWANAAFLDLADQVDPSSQGTWPPRKIFETDTLRGVKEGRRRSVIVDGASNKKWYNCGCAKLGDEYLFHAVSVDAAVKAEVELQEFRQTLSRTFAQIPIGLAVFDRNQRLAIFNPAFLDLTKLPFSLLSNRPTFGEFLDQLRNSNAIPEPKDYAAWREKIAALVRSESAEVYEEDWHLPSGQVLRVKGRPYTDGSVTFFVEDVSTSIASAREFHTQLQVGQAVANSMDQAIAVVSAEGKIAIANSAYDKMWGIANTRTKDMSVLDATKIWHSRCAPSPIWGEFRDFASQRGDRAEWSADTRLWDGRRMSCQFVPLPGGSTMVKFKIQKNHPSYLGQRLEITERPALDA